MAPHPPSGLHSITDGPALIFVHGITAPYNDAGFGSLLDPILNVRPGRVVPFQYFQDAGYEQGGNCVSPMPLPSVDPNSAMPVSYTGSETDICDSKSDLGLNAVALHAFVQTVYAATGHPVILVANSMGAAVVRGFLSYSADLDDGVAETMVDSTIYLQGAHDGSYLAKLAAIAQGALLTQCIGSGSPYCTPIGRPAETELADQSAWYQWANPGPSRLPDLPAFNVYGDIAFQEQRCSLFMSCADVGAPASAGDTVLLPGTDDPFDMPAGGGARFLPFGESWERWQWSVGGVDRYEAFNLFNAPDLGWAFSNPAAHTNFKDNLTTLEVTDCAGAGTVNLRWELTQIILGRMDGDPYLCDHAEG